MSSQNILKFSEGDEGVVVEEFSDEETKILDKFVTNNDSNIFAYLPNSGIGPEQIGALLSRYSRTALTGRKLFLKEFYPNKERGREFFDAWLVDYGDDSIQEMAGGIPMACEFVSNVAVKEIEDSRFGSYIEKSTRYVFFDKKFANGEYMFYKDPDIMASRYADRYLDLMRGLFDSYVKHTPTMAKYIQESNPFESQVFRKGEMAIKVSELTKDMEEKYGASESDLFKAYENATKANALDFVRDYLPMSTLTHVGINANSRTYENIMFKLLSSPLHECKTIGNDMYRELDKIVPSLVKRTFDKHGKEQVDFLGNMKANGAKAAGDSWESTQIQKVSGSAVKLIQYSGEDSDDANKAAAIEVVCAILYKFGEGYSIEQARKAAESMTTQQLDKVISAYLGDRLNRRHRPGRAFENVDYLFDFVGRVGIYRDIQRHRVGTQERQNFTTRLGFNMRDEFNDVGIAEDYLSKMKEVEELYEQIHEKMPQQAQYVVTFGFNIRWYYRLNARQLFHLCELRSTPSGHPDYRKIVQEMYTKVSEIHPSIGRHMKFVDMSQTKLGRLNAEIRIAQKKNALKRHD